MSVSVCECVCACVHVLEVVRGLFNGWLNRKY